MIKAKVYTVHCSTCLCILGISIKNLHNEKVYCLKCAKKKLKNNGQRKKDEDTLGESSGDTKQKQGKTNNEQNACGSGNHADTQVPKPENKRSGVKE